MTLPADAGASLRIRRRQGYGGTSLKRRNEARLTAYEAHLRRMKRHGVP